ncbi:hypothetical protein [Novosphingobium sp.]|uniref:calcium-binding protein n=1 Tax=Novosphingobium sp. TaxID=1874826 RepID=UPI002606DBE5|nr:hypothetical protein [Novosphingobium sp.]
MVKGTSGADVLNIEFGDTVSAGGGADVINVLEGDNYYDGVVTPYGIINGGAGLDRLVLKAPENVSDGDWIFHFSDVRSIEELGFTNSLIHYDRAQFSLTLPGTAQGVAAVGRPLAIFGSAGGNEVAWEVTGGMGSATAITFPRLTFTDFAKGQSFGTGFSPDYVEIRAGDALDYVLQASNVIGRLGIEQDLIGNAGDDTLIGSVGGDYLSGNGGADKLYGKSGDDMLAISVNAQPVAGDLLDGGAGTDYLWVIGSTRTQPVVFNGTLVSIEGIRLSSLATLLITAEQMAALPSALKISGRSTSTLAISDAQQFSAAKFNFVVDTAPKIIIAGTDGANVLIGSSRADELNGLGGKDRLIGGDGYDRLHGGDGADQLTGGLAGDAFVFETSGKAAGRDTIVDFSSAQGDVIEIARSGFAGVVGGVINLTADEFYAAAGAKAAHDASDRIVYDTTSGILYHDADGLGGQAAVAFALLKGAPALAAMDILVV